MMKSGKLQTIRVASRWWMAITAVCTCTTAMAATNEPQFMDFSFPAKTAPAKPAPETARELYNAGTRMLDEGKLNDAETLLSSALAKQDDSIQPRTLFNLAHVRFAQGIGMLKEGPSANGATLRSAVADNIGARAIQMAEAALAGTNLHKMVAAYLNGRGAHRELRAAEEAVRQAMEVYGSTLLKWRRADGDFKSASELNPADTNATHNAEVVEQAIARLVDSVHRMQQAMMASGGTSSRLKELMKQLRGRIPDGMIPPGAGGGDDEDTPPMEAMRGAKELPARSGKEMKLRLSREEAGQLLDSVRLDGNRRLPVFEGKEGPPENRTGRTW